MGQRTFFTFLNKPKFKSDQTLFNSSCHRSKRFVSCRTSFKSSFWSVWLPIVLFFCLFLPRLASSSLGDQLMYFLNCASNCYEHRCSNSQLQRLFRLNQRLWNRLLGWDCDEECRYYCEWNTIEYLQKRKSLGHWQLPQFYGKASDKILQFFNQFTFKN